MSDSVAHRAVVARLFPGATLTAADRLTGGVSAEVYRLSVRLVDGSSTAVVLRIHGETHSGHPADLEHQLLQAVSDAGVAAPKPLLVDTSRELLPYPFLVIDYVAGDSSIPADDLTRYVNKMADALVAVHNTPVANLPDLPERGDPLPEVFDYLPEANEWQALRDHLKTLQNTAYQGNARLLHGDFWPENLLWQQGSLVGIIDWEDAALGDPLSDVAAASVELRYKFGPKVMQAFTHRYAKHEPVDEWRLALWQVYVAAAAQRFMGQWGLPEQQLQHMRQEALASIREAGDALLTSSN